MLARVDGPALWLARDRSLSPVRGLSRSVVLVLREHAWLKGSLVDSGADARELLVEATLSELGAVVESGVLLLLGRCIFRDDVLAVRIPYGLESLHLFRGSLRVRLGARHQFASAEVPSLIIRSPLAHTC